MQNLKVFLPGRSLNISAIVVKQFVFLCPGELPSEFHLVLHTKKSSCLTWFWETIFCLLSAAFSRKAFPVMHTLFLRNDHTLDNLLPPKWSCQQVKKNSMTKQIDRGQAKRAKNETPFVMLISGSNTFYEAIRTPNEWMPTHIREVLYVQGVLSGIFCLKGKAVTRTFLSLAFFKTSRRICGIKDSAHYSTWQVAYVAQSFTNTL